MTLLAVAGTTTPTPTFPKGIKLETLAAGSALVRIHHRNHGPIWFGPKAGLPPSSRFDAPDGQYRTLYAALTLDGAFVETILHGRVGTSILSRSFVFDRGWSVLRTMRDLRLAKLHGDGLFWHGTDASISSERDYTEPRRVALALHSEGADIDGISYRSRHNNNEVCVALFDRVDEWALQPQVACLFSHGDAELSRLMDLYGVALSPDTPIPPPGR